MTSYIVTATLKQVVSHYTSFKTRVDHHIVIHAQIEWRLLEPNALALQLKVDGRADQIGSKIESICHWIDATSKQSKER
ncbi:unnamed protein product [Protopolystoma xenopodis]|uniref:Uncharacterized protein n=1 Tax=Protopolystoma xenopodis TaxID=117903 RepID=A0A3S4ZV95_9PLAT|nr:unnamed protein product [Protopolystoma xenopodis]